MASNGAPVDDDRQRKINFAESHASRSPMRTAPLEALKANSAELRGQVTKSMGSQMGTRVMTRLEKLQEQVWLES
jgi:hypothetical protein